jgi:hypothetical protein
MQKQDQRQQAHQSARVRSPMSTPPAQSRPPPRPSPLPAPTAVYAQAPLGMMDSSGASIFVDTKVVGGRDNGTESPLKT